MDDAWQPFLAEYAAYGYWALFFGVLLENAGVPLPGETAVLVAAFLASPAGGGQFELGLVILLTVAAAVTGDNVGYWLGRTLARPRLRNSQRFLLLTPRTLQIAQTYFQRYGLWTVFFARFVAALRVIGALAAGTAGMPWPPFFAANLAGATVWGVSVSLLGYFFGHSLGLLERWLGRIGLLSAGAVVVLAVTVHLLHRWRKARLARP